MTIDVTNNTQYVALKQSYDTRIGKDQQVEDLWKDLNDAQDQLRYTSSAAPEADALVQRYQGDMNRISSPELDPTGAIRAQITSGQDPVALLQQQETDALQALASVLDGDTAKDAVDQANQTALNTTDGPAAPSTPATPPPPPPNLPDPYGADSQYNRDVGDSTNDGAADSWQAPPAGSGSGTTGTAGSGSADAPSNTGTDATQGTGATDERPTDEDIMTRALVVMAMLGNACDGCSNGFMDTLTDNCDKIDQLNGLSQAVRSARPSGSDSTVKRDMYEDTVNQLKQLGVTLPDDMNNMTPNAAGQYLIPQSDFDTILNNVQSQSSSLTTLNQNTTISMNKAIDASQQCSTFESGDLEKWAQLMQKILS
jgi:hypothetical protein